MTMSRMQFITVLINVCYFISFRIQQVDNGFFEKFGSLFREHSEFVAAQEKEEKEKVKEEAARITADVSDGSQEDLKRVTEDEESTTTSDSEIEEPDKAELVGVGLNVSYSLLFISFNLHCSVTYMHFEIANFITSCILFLEY